MATNSPSPIEIGGKVLFGEGEYTINNIRLDSMMNDLAVGMEQTVQVLVVLTRPITPGPRGECPAPKEKHDATPRPQDD